MLGIPEHRTENHIDKESMPKRRFIGWGKPILESTVGRLFDEFSEGFSWDMRELVVVLPGGLAGRRLAELLAIKAEETESVLYPPQIVTVGALPERLYVAKYPFASDIVQQLAWMTVLQQMPLGDLKHLTPVPPPKSMTVQWLELSKLLSSIHHELASEQLNFSAVASALGDHPERPRWDALSTIQQKYLDFLDGLELWDVQTARLCALEYKEPETSKRIIVVGCVDLSQTLRGFLGAVGKSVEVWIAAPESAGESFDRFGCLHSAAWQSFELDLAPSALLVGNTPSDQAELTAACLAELNDRYHTRQVTIGVPDRSLVAELRHSLDLSGARVRYGAGTPLDQSEPARLLALIGTYLETQSYVAFAALIRHPAVENLLRVSKTDMPRDWLAKIDQYYQTVLPKKMDGFVNESAAGADVFQTVSKVVGRWLRKLSARPHGISSFVQPLLSILGTAYDRLNCDLDDPAEGALYAAASQVSAAIVALRDIPENLQPKLTGAELIDWLTNSMRGQLVPEAIDAEAIEMLGWLELAFDDAPVLVVTGMHDGVVPESVNSDAFLPNGLRRQLGMMDNDRRYARDMYTMQVMLRSREQVRFVVGKTDASGDPLVPSRLLMACGLKQLPARVLHLVGESEVDVLPAVSRRWNRRGGKSELAIPRPENIDPPTQISVTAFRDYLRCPYRFYLRHVLRLRSDDDALAELDAPQFGVLLHDTLALLEGAIGSCTDADEVRKFLVDSLHGIATDTYGPNPAAAVLIQIEQAELRLAAFAEKQAERAAEGWEIRFVEQGASRGDRVLVGEHQQLFLIGRIDRIDYHPESRQWAIWDYKTSETAKDPVSVHWSKNKGWQDLQLPLYRAIAKKLGVTGTPTLGYIAIPKQAPDTGFHVAKFSQEQLDDADRVAVDVAERIASGDFWPETIESVAFDDFARVCQASIQQVTVNPPSRSLNRCTEEHAVAIDDAVLVEAKKLVDSPISSQPDLPPVLIRASAGTGKTFQLSNRLLQIVLSGQEVDHILATTFTRKAAGEIMHRVLQRLALACINADDRGELTTHLTGVDTSAENCLASLRRFTASIHRLRISTLDSFFAQVARAFSLEMSLPPGWNAMDPVQEPQFQLQSIGRMLENHDRKTLVDLVRMLAKGESGRQVTEEIRRTVGAGYGPYRITEPENWDQLPLPEAPSESAVESALMTVESIRLDHKTADSKLQKLHLDASIGNWESVIAHGIYAKLIDGSHKYYGRELSSDLVTALEILVERSAAVLLPIRRNQTLASYQVLAAYDSEYTALVRQYRTLAFADVTHTLSQWMSTDESTARGRLEFRLDCGVHHLLLDEFQDTAPEQWRILRPLATPLAGGSDSRRSMLCVGDAKQAIYGWRGGVAEVFDSVTQAMPGIEQQELRDSYRSSPEVINVVNEVFSNLNRHSNFAECDSVASEWSSRFPEHRTAVKNSVGYVRLQNGPELDSDMTSEEKRVAFLDYTADQIAEVTSKSSAGVGVLFRTNADVARMIAILRDKGVSASQEGGNPLVDSSAVELILSLVHLSDHPGDRICLFHVATSPLASKLPFSHPHDAFSLRSAKRSATDPQDATAIASWFRLQVSRLGLGTTIESIADMLADRLSWWDQHRLQQLIRLGHEYQESYGGRLREFEEAVEFQRVALPTEAQVKVMTIHKSKGLEFDAVFLPDLAVDMASSNALLVLRGDDPCEPPTGVLRYMKASLQARLPDSWQRAFAQQKQRFVTESLCMLYVAMTRARVALYMTSRPTGGRRTQQFGSLLQSTLGNKELTKLPQTTQFESGDPDWHTAFPTVSPTIVVESDQANRRIEIDEPTGVSPQMLRAGLGMEAEAGTLTIALRTDLESAPARGLRVAAPSYIGKSFEPIPLAGAFSYSQSLGAIYGTVIHAFFEQIQWLEQFEFDRNELRKVSMAAVSPEQMQMISLERAISDFEELLQLDSIHSALSKSRYRQQLFGITADRVDIDNERIVSLLMDGQLISGTIDRLAILVKDGVPYAAEIIDFKTDAFDASMTLLWLDDRIEHHRPQLEVYAKVVSKLFRIPAERIATYLVMLSTDDFVRVDRHAPPGGQGSRRDTTSGMIGNIRIQKM